MADNEGIGGKDVESVPTVTVDPMVLTVVEAVREEGTGIVDVADARGEEKAPDIPSSLLWGESDMGKEANYSYLKKGEKAEYAEPLTFKVVDWNAM